MLLFRHDKIARTTHLVSRRNRYSAIPTIARIACVVSVFLLGLGGGIGTAFAATEYVGVFSIGPNTNNLNHNPGSGPNAACLTFTAPSDIGTVLSISYYMSGGGSDTLAIWSASGAPTTLISGSTLSFTAPSSAGWATTTYATPPTLTPGGSYCVGYTSGSLSTFYYFNGTVAGNTYVGFTSSDSTPSSLSSATNSTGAGGGNNISVYIAYTPSSGVPAAIKVPDPIFWGWW